MTDNFNITATVEDEALVTTRRAQIVAAATALFSSQGYYKTTIKDIAKKAGISPGLVYLYVREKEDVLLLVLLQVVNAYADEIPNAIEGIDDPLKKLMTAVRAYCEVVDRFRPAAVLAYRSTKSLSPERRLLIQNREIETNELLGAIIVECMKGGLVRKLNVDIVIYQIVMAAHGWALKSWYFKNRFVIGDYVDETLDVLLAGILTDKGKRHLEKSR